MLPSGLTAQPVDRLAHQRLQQLHPAARTVVRLIVGGCSCDLVRARHADPREDERQHRARRRHGEEPREVLLATLQRHRLGALVPVPPRGWPLALARFVAEHARNAGDTLYLLTFGAGSSSAPPEPGGVTVRRLSASDVLARPDAWLTEATGVIVGR
jgi:alkylation response protein AidB-like acyl-CoA dehydrogenase